MYLCNMYLTSCECVHTCNIHMIYVYMVYIYHIYTYTVWQICASPRSSRPSSIFTYVHSHAYIKRVCVCVIMWVIMCVITCAREFIFYVLSVHVNMFYVQSVIESCIHK